MYLEHDVFWISCIILLLFGCFMLFTVFKWNMPKEVVPQILPDERVELVKELTQQNVVNDLTLDLQQTDSLDAHLDSLTWQLAEKEGCLVLSRSKIREKQCEFDSLSSSDVGVHQKYQNTLETLRNDMISNERQCRELQDQIEWISRKRAELNEDIRLGHQMYGKAAEELASSLMELQKGRPSPIPSSTRLRKEPNISCNFQYKPYVTKPFSRQPDKCVRT